MFRAFQISELWINSETFLFEHTVNLRRVNNLINKKDSLYADIRQTKIYWKQKELTLQKSQNKQQLVKLKYVSPKTKGF